MHFPYCPLHDIWLYYFKQTGCSLIKVNTKSSSLSPLVNIILAVLGSN